MILAKHILNIVQIDYKSIEEIMNGFQVNEQWQAGNARMFDVRQASFKIHQIARNSDTKIIETPLRVVGQAVASGHMQNMQWSHLIMQSKLLI